MKCILSALVIFTAMLPTANAHEATEQVKLNCGDADAVISFDVTVEATSAWSGAFQFQPRSLVQPKLAGNAQIVDRTNEKLLFELSANNGGIDNNIGTLAIDLTVDPSQKNNAKIQVTDGGREIVDRMSCTVTDTTVWHAEIANGLDSAPNPNCDYLSQRDCESDSDCHWVATAYPACYPNARQHKAWVIFTQIRNRQRVSKSSDSW